MDELDATVARLETSAPLLGFQLCQPQGPNFTMDLPSQRSAQEHLFYVDVIGIIVGGFGNYFLRQHNPTRDEIEYVPTPTADRALCDAISPLLNLAINHQTVKGYAGLLSDLNMGRVNQALGAAFSGLSSELVGACANLEQQPTVQPFGLQDLNLALAPLVRKFEHAVAVIQELKQANTTGGAVLYLLSRRLETVRGSAIARELLTVLIDAASKPFLKMLTSWIYHGIIDDPFLEFMVQVRSHDSPLSQDWDKYYIDDNLLPLELSTSDLYHQVLLAGKYLNVIAECQEESMEINDLESPTSLLDNSLLLLVSEAYQISNERLLDLLEKRNLEQRLVEFKHTFFLDNSDFLPTFLETVQKDLHKPAESVSIQKLQYALDIAIQQPGSISSEQHLDDLRVSLAQTGLVDELLTIANVSGVTVEQLEKFGDDAVQPSKSNLSSSRLTVLQALQLDFEIPFPQNLVISKSSVFRYQFLFRLFLTLRTTIEFLGEAWAVQTKSAVWRKRSQNEQLEKIKAKAGNLRSRILNLFQTMLYYCTTNVIEANWRQFFDEIPHCKTVDSLQRHHLAFLDKCLKECLLTRPTLLRCQARLFRTASLYAKFLQSHELTLSWIDPSVLSPETKLDPLLNSKGIQYSPQELLVFLSNTVDQYEQSHSKYVKLLIEELGAATASENAILRNLLSRIDDTE